MKHVISIKMHTTNIVMNRFAKVNNIFGRRDIVHGDDIIQCVQ